LYFYVRIVGGFGAIALGLSRLFRSPVQLAVRSFGSAAPDHWRIEHE